MAQTADLTVTLQSHATFYGIAWQANGHVQELVKRRRKLRKQEDAKKRRLTEDEEERLAILEASIERSAMVAVIFSALTLEAYVNDYAIEKWSKRFLETYLDHLDPPSKWLVIPWLATGRKLDTAGQAFEGLRRLFPLRNKLVHFKTVTKPMSQIDRQDKINEDDATQAVKLVRELVEELMKIDPSLDPDAHAKPEEEEDDIDMDRTDPRLWLAEAEDPAEIARM